MAASPPVSPAEGGSGARIGRAVILTTGTAALSATLLTLISLWLQLKNYRKPLLQRYVVRILVMVPIFSASSWTSLVSVRAAMWIGPIRDIYEAFTIYTFFQLLINFIGGERALIIKMYGRPPVAHLWPLNYCLPKADISDPHTFLAIKRGILQYTWMKPLLAIATIIMKATGSYKEGYIGIDSGYLWSGLIYNVSITISLYSLAMFWVCMLEDLKPFRPIPKFLCVKGIIFASYWQGFFLSILVWLGAFRDNSAGYSADNYAAAIQDALICFEMPVFALSHWYAFSWRDFADLSVSHARLPVKYAFRDAFGPGDLIKDSKDTFGGKHYEYRHFDAQDQGLGHEESNSRAARMSEGMRYARGGKGKYWLPNAQNDSRTPLLGNSAWRPDQSSALGTSRQSESPDYSAISDEIEETVLDDEEEGLYEMARTLDYGDWNYPVITAHIAIREQHVTPQQAVVYESVHKRRTRGAKDSSRRGRAANDTGPQGSIRKGKQARYPLRLTQEVVASSSASGNPPPETGRPDQALQSQSTPDAVDSSEPVRKKASSPTTSAETSNEAIKRPNSNPLNEAHDDHGSSDDHGRHESIATDGEEQNPWHLPS